MTLTKLVLTVLTKKTMIFSKTGSIKIHTRLTRNQCKVQTDAMKTGF